MFVYYYGLVFMDITTQYIVLLIDCKHISQGLVTYMCVCHGWLARRCLVKVWNHAAFTAGKGYAYKLQLTCNGLSAINSTGHAAQTNANMELGSMLFWF